MSNKMPQHGEFCWNELMTADTKKAKEFYSELLGWKSQDADMGEMGTYTMFKQGDTDVGGMMAIPKEKQNEMPPHWMCYINVTDIDETVQKAKKLGATIKVENKDVGDFGRLAVIQDPTGAYIAFWQQLKPPK